MFSFTADLLRARRTPLELMAQVVDEGLARIIEIDGAQHFASYPHFSPAEVEQLADERARLGISFGMFGVYDDRARRPGHLHTLDESVAYLSRQMEVAAQLGFVAVRIAFGIDPDLLARLAVEAERWGVSVWQEVQGATQPGEQFERQQLAIERIGSDKLGFVFDTSACMPALPVTYLEELRRIGVPEDVVNHLDAEWSVSDPATLRAGLDGRMPGASLNPEQSLRLSMAFGRFGHTSMADWRDVLPHFRAIHLKYWDLEDEDQRVSRPLADVRRMFGSAGFDGLVTSEWGGHEWMADADAFRMTREHRAIYDSALTAA